MVKFKKSIEKRILAYILSMMIVLLTACAAPAVSNEPISTPVATPQATEVAATPQPTEAAVAPTATLSAEEAAQKQLCDEIVAKADERREAILSSPTEVTVTGTSYYVSAEGDDGNDGLTPETPWRTAAKVNEASLQPGDGVFFRRGDIWRMDMIANNQEGVTYSAYGEGAKPAFYGSPENGSGADKWALLEGTKNIWIYEKELPFCGSIVMNAGEVVATQHLSYWNGAEYTEYGTADIPVNVKSMKNLCFFSDIDLTKWQEDTDHHNANGDLHVYNCLETGTLYLRSDEGNPGELYEDIQFSTGWGLTVGGGCVVDNLCVQYVGNCGVMSDPGSSAGITVQNCEVGFMGDVYITFEQDDCHGVGGGEGFGFNGYGSVCRNNYVHDGRDGCFTIELGWDSTIQDGQSKMGGLTATGNLFARSNGGIGIINFLEEDAPIEISDILIDDNYFVETGYRNVLFDGVEENVACIHVWFAGGWDDLKGVTISNNVFFLAAPKLINLLNIGDAELDFEGNTYVQGKYQRALTYAPTYDSEQNVGAADENAFEAAVHDLLGDSTATVHTITLGLDHAEVNRARKLGLVPDSAPEELSTQITEREMVELLTTLIEYSAPDKLSDWKAVSESALTSDYAMNHADGMIALFEVVKAMGWDVTANDRSWQNFDRINAIQGSAWDEIDCANMDIWSNARETDIDPDNPSLCLYHLAMLYSIGEYYHSTNTYLLDYDAANAHLDGTTPLTWEAAINAVIRLVDSLDADTDKAYLVQLGS